MSDVMIRLDARAPRAAGIDEPWCIRGVRAVTPTGIVEDATITCHGGVVVDIAERGTPGPAAIDGRGALLLPGLVDLHSDALMAASGGITRDGGDAASFTLRAVEGQLRAAGITTAAHSLDFTDHQPAWTTDVAHAHCDAVARQRVSGHAMIDHRVMLGFDLAEPRGFKGVVARTERRRGDADPGDAPLVRIMGSAESSDRTDRHGARRWLAAAAAQGRIRSIVSGPRTPFDIDEAEELHAAIVETPATMAAATAARDRGLLVAANAVGILLHHPAAHRIGRITSDELVAAGACDVLTSRGTPSALLGAVIALAEGGTDLVDAVALASAAPAQALGRGDRGRVAIGARADLILVTVSAGLPTVRATWSAEDES